MVWIVGALCLILFGAGIGVIGLSLNMFGYAIVGGIMVLAGILFQANERVAAVAFNLFEHAAKSGRCSMRSPPAHREPITYQLGASLGERRRHAGSLAGRETPVLGNRGFLW